MKQEGETMVAKVAKIYCAKFRTDEQKSFDFSKRQDSKIASTEYLPASCKILRLGKHNF